MKRAILTTFALLALFLLPACQKELEEMFDRFMGDEDFYKEASKICHDYVAGKIGATSRIMNCLKI